MNNIEIAERFINGLGRKDTTQLPLHKDAELHTALSAGRVIRGKDNICSFLNEETFPLTPSYDPAFPPVIENHITQGNIVFSFWNTTIAKTKVVQILNYFEIEDGLIKLVKPYYHSLSVID